MFEQLTTLSAYLFFGMTAFLLVVELIVPATASAPHTSVNRRWSSNIGLYLSNALVSRFLLPLSAVVVSELPLTHKLGLLHQFPVSVAVAVVLGILSLDALSYLQHRIFHACKPLWRLHLVHHTDTDLDVTTTVRHHPLEVALGTLILYGFVVVSGIPALAILLYGLAETCVSLVSHANVRFPAKWERCLAWLIVTPAVHSVHHSAQRPETDSNFGMVFTLWDRVFGTYRELPAGRVAPEVTGLEYYRSPADGGLLRLLLLPFLPLPSRSESVAVSAVTLPRGKREPCRD